MKDSIRKVMEGHGRGRNVREAWRDVGGTPGGTERGGGGKKARTQAS